MTGIAFLKRLTFQLDFLNEEDKKTVISFYERKLSNADTLLEEEAIVKSFGSPEHIAKKLKEAYFSHLSAENSVSSESEDDNTVTAAEEKETNEAEDSENNIESEKAADDGDDDLIFSKPTVPKQAAEMIHSLENKEVKTLYGEKVVIEDRAEPIEEITIEPIDDENGLTEEEIRQAKEETLEKANNFTTASIELPAEFLDADEDTVDPMDETEEQATIAVEAVEIDTPEVMVHNEEENPDIVINDNTDLALDKEVSREETDISALESNEEIITEESEEETKTSAENEVSTEDDCEKKDFICDDDKISQDTIDEITPVTQKSGIITGLFPKTMPSALRIIFSVLLSIIVSPILLVVFGAGIISYTVAALIILAVAILTLAFIAALVVLAVAELIFGFASLFDSVSIALIEIGIGTVLFGIVTAIAALVYEFLFGVVPKAIKNLTKYFVIYLKKVSSFLYGGKV